MIVHGHCHQKTLFGMKGETALLDKLGALYALLDSGCCGMASAFGFDVEHYQLSMKVAEGNLLRSLREAPTQALLVTNGFSCREQIEQGANRDTFHIAQLVLLALQNKTPDQPGCLPFDVAGSGLGDVKLGVR